MRAPSILKPLGEMSEPELANAFRLAVAYDEILLFSLFGLAGARRYKRLERTSESMDLTRADEASDQLLRMQGSLSAVEQNLLFGIGDPLDIPEPGDVLRTIRVRGYCAPEVHRMLAF